jgi:hypothetical protein
MNAQFPQGLPAPRPPKRGLGTGWIVTIVAVSMVVVIGVAVGVFSLLSSSSNKSDGKYGATPPANCDDVAKRAGDLPPKSSETSFAPGQAWRCSFADSTDTVKVDLDLKVSDVKGQRAAFGVYTSMNYPRDPTVHLGENAVWAPSPFGVPCSLYVLDSNAIFEVSYDDNRLDPREDVGPTCKIQAKAVMQAFYTAMQPR